MAPTATEVGFSVSWRIKICTYLPTVRLITHRLIIRGNVIHLSSLTLAPYQQHYLVEKTGTVEECVL